MRKLLVLAAIAGIATAGSALGADTAQQTAMKGCSAKWSAMSAADKAKTKHNDFMSSCLKAPATTAGGIDIGNGKTGGGAMAMKPAATGSMAMKPAAAGGSMAMKPTAAGSMAKPAAAGAMGGQAKCKDGTVVTYKNRQGTCSGHKGVATWL